MENKNDDRKEYLQGQHQIIKKYREILYFSYIVAIYSYVEQELSDIVETLSCQNTMETIKPSELVGGGCLRAVLFLNKICRLTMPSDILYKQLNCIRIVRNSFVHNNCKVGWKKQYVKYVTNNIKGISLEKDNLEKGYIIAIDEEFCFFATDVIHQYLFDLVKNNHDGFYSYLLSYN